jgi:hypothetical protein
MTVPQVHVVAVEGTLRTDIGEEHEEYRARVTTMATESRGLGGGVISSL